MIKYIKVQKNNWESTSKGCGKCQEIAAKLPQNCRENTRKYQGKKEIYKLLSIRENLTNCSGLL